MHSPSVPLFISFQRLYGRRNNLQLMLHKDNISVTEKTCMSLLLQRGLWCHPLHCGCQSPPLFVFLASPRRHCHWQVSQRWTSTSRRRVTYLIPINLSTSILNLAYCQNEHRNCYKITDISSVKTQKCTKMHYFTPNTSNVLLWRQPPKPQWEGDTIRPDPTPSAPRVNSALSASQSQRLGVVPHWYFLIRPLLHRTIGGGGLWNWKLSRVCVVAQHGDMQCLRPNAMADALQLH